MTAIVLIGLAALCVSSVVATVIFSLGSAIGYRRGLADGRRPFPDAPKAHVAVLEEALSAAGRN